MVELVRPQVRFEASCLAGLAAFKAEGLPWFQEMDLEWIGAHFEEYVHQELAATTPGAGPTPQTRLWGILDGRYVGRIAIRHELNDALTVVGGHIGYETVPEFRRRGIGTQMLASSLPIAKSLAHSAASRPPSPLPVHSPAGRSGAGGGDNAFNAAPRAGEGLERVLLTCDDTNVGSIRIIEHNGGVLEKKAQVAEGGPPKRYYWIAL